MLAPYDRVDRYTYFPLHLLVYHYKSSHNLINYARAHNSLRLHTEVSSMNNLMIPLNLGGGPKEKQAILEYPGTSIQIAEATRLWIPINTNGKVECRNRNPNVSLTRRKILQHETLQPQRVSTLNVLANSRHRIMMNNSYHYMNIWLVENSNFIMFLRKANFSLLQRNTF